MSNRAIVIAVAAVMLLGSQLPASKQSIGPDGINSMGLIFNGIALTGVGVKIGQVERGRPGCPNAGACTVPDMAANHSDFVNPTAVTINAGNAALPDMDLDFGHPTRVASVLISTDATDSTPPAVPPDPPNPGEGDYPIGVAPGASLYSDAVGSAPTLPLLYQNDVLSAQYLSKIVGMRAINHSYGFLKLSPSDESDGNSQLTLGLDWLAREHDVLNIFAGNPDSDTGSYPTDNFNGMTVGSSVQVIGLDGSRVFRRVAAHNRYDDDAAGDRTSISLIAPGGDNSVMHVPPLPFGTLELEVAGLDNSETLRHGTSYAAPHVTGVAALLHQAAIQLVSPNAHRHEVIKAVLMNSADKFLDDGTELAPGANFGSYEVVDRGRLLGMDRTVVKQDGTSTWWNSDAYTNELIALDLEMGAGHLNAKRALQQFRNGQETGLDPVPMIGWDYGTAVSTGLGGVQKYVFNQPLLEDSFISVTIASDRKVNLINNVGSPQAYDPGDAFEEYTETLPYADDVISDLDVYLMPEGAMDFNQVVTRQIHGVSVDAVSENADGTVDHLFFQIPSTGKYEIWVRMWDDDIGPVDYGIAWWAVTAAGDFNGDQSWDCMDLDALAAAIVAGSTNPIYDMNQDGIVDVDDILDKESGWLTAGGAIDSNAQLVGPGNTSGLSYLPGDANLDGAVDGTDWGIWNVNKFTGTGWCSGDWNADGTIDGSDFGIWNVNKWTNSQTSSLPEPANLVFWVILAVAVHTRRSAKGRHRPGGREIS